MIGLVFIACVLGLIALAWLLIKLSDNDSDYWL